MDLRVGMAVPPDEADTVDYPLQKIERHISQRKLDFDSANHEQ